MLIESVYRIVKHKLTPENHSSGILAECVHISQGGRNECGGAGGMQFPCEYMLNQVPKRAKQPCNAIACNCDFCDFDPPRVGGQKLHKADPDWLSLFHLYQQNKRLKGLIDRSPVARTVRGFIPPNPGVRVTKPSPNDPGVVLNPRYMLEQYVDERAKPPLTWVAPKHEGKGLHPGANPGCCTVPKKEGAINPIYPWGELGCSPSSRTKIEHISLNSHPFHVVFSGIFRF